MISVGKWRWPLVVLIPLLVGFSLFAAQVVRLSFEGKAILVYSGKPKTIENDLKLFRQSAAGLVKLEAVPGQPMQVALKAEGPWPSEAAKRVSAAGRAYVALSLSKHRETVKAKVLELQTQSKMYETRFNQLTQERAAILQGPTKAPSAPKADLVGKIEALKARRRQLIDHYPTHSDIPLLAKQIQELLQQQGRRSTPVTAKTEEFDRPITESKVRQDYFARRAQAMADVEKNVKADWRLEQPVAVPQRPNRVDGWPVGAGAMAAAFVLSALLFTGRKKDQLARSASGLWRPSATDAPSSAVAEKPVDLQVVSPEPETAVTVEAASPAPMDPLTEKAADLYTQWIALCKVLYAPAPQAPQGVLDRIGPLMQESSDFLVKGHDVLAKYLARSVTPGDLPAHVARTVLMTLTGAQEAGVTPEHRLAMALAALFHDLAVVSRPTGQQDDVGSEVGRLSAAVLRRIPGLPPALLSMVEEILVGMDEFKLETWQNVANGHTLEPLSKVLREIDRFEKVMQKQKSRLDRQISQKKAS